MARKSVRSLPAGTRRRNDTSGRSQVAHTGLVRRNAGPIAFPDRQHTTLTYVDSGRLTNGVNTFATQEWRLNSAFDPDFTGVGHQPRFFDTYAAIYARYIVTETRVRVCVRQRAAHGLSAILVPTNGSVALTPANYPQEYRRASEVRITSSNQPAVQFDTKYTPASVAGVTHAVYVADDRFQAGVASNPAEVINLQLYVSNLDGVTAVDAEYSVTFEYDVQFYDLAVPGPSLEEEASWTPVRAVEAPVSRQPANTLANAIARYQSGRSGM